MNKGWRNWAAIIQKPVFKWCLVKKKKGANHYIHYIVLGLSTLIVCVYIDIYDICINFSKYTISKHLRESDSGYWLLK